ncbi:MAG: FMN-binding protein [Ruminococcaceae bacterium]|nr:FMN-binding protein [Oscillospiraceae bacterium]
MAKKQTGKAAVVLVALFAVFTAAMIGLNTVTGPIIESNNAAGEFAPLFAVMSEAKDFEPVYAADGSVETTLVDVPETVQAIYAETSGMGYALKLSTTKGYTGNAIELTLGVDATGKIVGIQLDAYPETKDFGAEYPTTFVGQDSTLADVGVVAGCTYSSVAFRDAVADGFSALVNNAMISAGVKSDAQILTELALTAHTGLANNVGVGQYEEIAGTGNIQTILQAKNGVSFAYIMSNGDTSVLAICNGEGSVRVLDLEGNDVTADNAPLAEEAKAHAVANAKDTAEADLARLQRLLPDTTECTELALEGVFSSVTTGFEMKQGDAVYYGFVARSYAYDNIPSAVYYVLDANGTIVGMTAEELIIHAEYFSGYTLDEPAYKAGFNGLTAETFTGEQALISGATITSEAVKTATNDIFAAYKATVENGGANA